MKSPPTVFVVDDDSGVLNSLCWLICQADIPVQTFSSGRAFLAAYQPEFPGCLVLDVRMPTMSGLEVQEELWKRGISLPIIFITSHGDIPTCSAAFRNGAYDFLEKPVRGDLLISHIQNAIARDAQQRRHGSAAQYEMRLNQLTSREREVLESLIVGKSLKAIAAEHDVTVQTAWRHRGTILQKMGVENDADLVRMATLWTQERRTRALRCY
jgi:FixJ family two-component response regulator